MQAILFVPGFCGSHLYRRDDYGDRRRKIWLSQVDIGLGGISDLDTDAEVSPPTLDRVTPGAPLQEVYQPFLEYFAERHVPVAQFGYDFRADVATNGQRLAEVLERNPSSLVKLTIVGHSMGGLVVASAIQRINEQAEQSIDRIITCATPWRGAFRTLELFGGQHETVRKIVGLNAVFSRRNRFAWERETLRVIASWPGSYDLLPMPDMMLEYPPAEGQDFRTDAIFALKNPWFSLQQYTDAIARRPIHLGAPGNIAWHNLRGIGRPTSGPSPVMRDGYPDYWLQALHGDGTVPEFSSWPYPAFNAIGTDFNAEHEQFMNDSHVLRRIARIMGVPE